MGDINKGIVLLDKPAGITSRDAVDKVQEKLGVKKAGHSGTLDPQVTGVLLIALGEATKLMPVLMGLDKEYVGKMHIHKNVEKKEIEKISKKFIGKIKQTPPVRSRVVRKERTREVYFLEILKVEGRDVEFKVKSEAGFYVRKLCSDFGEKLSSGAHMTGLRRVAVGPFSEKEITKIEDLKQKHILDLENVLDRVGLKKVFVKKDFVEKVRNGVPLKKDGIEKTDKIKLEEKVGIYFNGKIIALGLKKRAFIKVDRVLLI